MHANKKITLIGIVLSVVSIGFVYGDYTISTFAGNGNRGYSGDGGQGRYC